MRIALFIPCYIDQFFPGVGIATLELLEGLGCDVSFPPGQTCCGQPLANTGMENHVRDMYTDFVNTFDGYDYIVAPSGSCTYHIRHHYDILDQVPEVKQVREKTLDLAEFLVDILRVKHIQGRFEARVGIHQSCHGLRGLRLGSASERHEMQFSKIHALLDLVDGIDLCTPDRKDECCGFGGTFAVNEPELSIAMGRDCIERHTRNEVDFITAGDMSCLMHLDGILRKQKSPVKVIHFAEILNHCKPKDA